MSDSFVINPDKLDGYPSFDSLGSFIQANLSTNKHTINCNPNYLSGYPSFRKNFPNTQEYPYPKYLLVCDNNYLSGYPSFARPFESFGAGKHSVIEEIEIPKSITYICDYAFYGSNITSVKINRHCMYFEHSFPDGCHIKPYKDDE